MKLSDQVCTLEQAKRLKKLGVKQDSILSWYSSRDRDDTPGLNKSRQYDCPTCGHPNASYFEEVAAYTTAELGVMLPDYFSVHRGHSGGYYCSKLMSTDPEATGPTMAQAMASRLITGLETGEFTAEEVNKRLST